MSHITSLVLICNKNESKKNICNVLKGNNHRCKYSCRSIHFMNTEKDSGKVRILSFG